jgi:hypothetical protein
MYSSQAYLHHYYKHGVEQASFDDGFLALEQVLANYRAL